MSDNEIQINIQGVTDGSKVKIQISISPDKTILDLKHAIAENSDIEVDRQELIYSGKMLKDERTLSMYKIQSSHTIHVVNGPSREELASPPSFDPFEAVGINPVERDAYLHIMRKPEFYQSLASFFSVPSVRDAMFINRPSNTEKDREFFGSDMVKQMLSNPETLQTLMYNSPVFRGTGYFPTPEAPSGATGMGATYPTPPATATQKSGN